MNRRPEIRRGSDVSFTIRLLDDTGRPYDLTNVTFFQLRLPKANTGSVTINSDLAHGTKAFSEAVVIDSEEAIFSAVTPGASGNNIVLIFDGTDTIDDVVDAWNLANDENQVEYDLEGIGAEVLTAQTITLSQGTNNYKKVEARTPLVLGELTVKLSNTDTEQLKIGKQQAIELTIDKGLHPTGDRKVVLLRDAISVEEKFF